MSLVGNSPLDGLPFGEVHRLSDGSGEVDVELRGVFALDELNFSWIAHEDNLVTRLDIESSLFLA